MLDYIAAIKTAFDVAKDIKKATDSIEDAQLKLQIADLISALADAKLEAVEREERIKELEKLLKTKESMYFKNGLYYKKSDTDNKIPFCPTCYEKENKEIHLQPKECAGGTWNCFVCESWYGDRKYKN